MRSVLAPHGGPARAAASSRREGFPEPPRLLVWLSVAVVVVSGLLAVLGAARTGATWDEPYHVMRLQNFLDHGWFALDWSMGAGGPTGEDTNTAVYAPVTMLLLHALGVVTGVETWGTVASTPAAYDVRHLGVVVIGLVGTAAAAGISRVLLGSWRWGLVTAATLLALPMWAGHLMFNIKDVPVAAGYTLTTLALILMLRRTGASPWPRIAALVLGLLLMVGTRPAMWAAVAVAGVVLIAGTVLTPAGKRTWLPLRGALIGVVAAAAVLLLLYPNLFSDPGNLIHSATQSASFRDGSDATVGYIPFFVITQTPWLLLGLFLLGLAYVATRAWALRSSRDQIVHATALALVAAQLLALPVVGILRHSDLYNALRQLLFATPAWAVITTLGVARLLVWARTWSRPRLAVGVVAVALALPMVDQALLFPYSYAYYNVALDATGIRTPSDYWRASVPELLDSIPTDGQIVCGPTRTGPEEEPSAMTAGRYTSDSSIDCRTDPLGPLAHWWTDRSLPLTDALPRDQFYVLIDRGHPLPANCTLLADVTRQRHLREIQMTYVARCEQEIPLLTAAPIAFLPPSVGENLRPEVWAYLPQGWVTRTSDGGVASARPRATLHFSTPEECRDQRCTLRVVGDADGPVQAEVNGTRVDVLREPDALEIPLAPATDDAWVTLSSGSTDPLDVRISSIRLTSAGASR